MLNNISFTGKLSPKNIFKNLDTSKVASYTAIGTGITIPICDSFAKTQEVKKVGNEITQEDINKKIQELYFKDTTLPKYVRVEKGYCEYNNANTITKYYDANNDVQMITITSPSGLLLQAEIYNQEGNITFGAHTEVTTRGYFVLSLSKFDGSEDENLLENIHKKISYKDLSEIS